VTNVGHMISVRHVKGVAPDENKLNGSYNAFPVQGLGVCRDPE
jgi:hypothetical protein